MAEVSGIKLVDGPSKFQTATTVEEAELQLRKSYAIPDGLVQLTRDMARQIFYHDPEDVQAFLADYLEGRLEVEALAAKGLYPIDADSYSKPRGEGCVNILGESMNADGTWYNNLLEGLQNPDDRQMAALLNASRLGLNSVLDDADADAMAGYKNVDLEAEAKAKREREADEEFELLTGEYYMPEGFELLGVDLSGTEVKDVASKLNPGSVAGSKGVSVAGSKGVSVAGSKGVSAAGSQVKQSSVSPSGKLLDVAGSEIKDGAQYSESGKLLSGNQDGALDGAQYSESGRLLAGDKDGAQYSESGRLLSENKDGAPANGAQYSESGRLLTGNQDGVGADGAQYSESGRLLSGNQDDAGADGAQYSESGRLLSGNQDGTDGAPQYSQSGKLLSGSQEGATDGKSGQEGADGGVGSSGVTAGEAMATAAAAEGSRSGLGAGASQSQSGQGGQGGQALSGSASKAGAGAGGPGSGAQNEFDESGKPVGGAGGASVTAVVGSGQNQGGQAGANDQSQGQVDSRNRQTTDNDAPPVMEEWPTTVQPYLAHRPNANAGGAPGPQEESSNTYMVIGLTALVALTAGYFIARSLGYFGSGQNGGGGLFGFFGRRTSRGSSQPLNVNVGLDIMIENRNIARALGHGLPEAQGLAKCPAHHAPPQPIMPTHIAQARKI